MLAMPPADPAAWSWDGSGTAAGWHQRKPHRQQCQLSQEPCIGQFQRFCAFPGSKPQGGGGSKKYIFLLLAKILKIQYCHPGLGVVSDCTLPYQDNQAAEKQGKALQKKPEISSSVWLGRPRLGDAWHPPWELHFAPQP